MGGANPRFLTRKESHAPGGGASPFPRKGKANAPTGRKPHPPSGGIIPFPGKGKANAPGGGALPSEGEKMRRPPGNPGAAAQNQSIL